MNFPRNLFIERAKAENHSEEYLTKTLNYIDNLNAQNLPVIFSTQHLAQLLNLNYHKLNDIIEYRSNYYTYYLIKKRTKGHRRIIAPYTTISEIQNWIKTNILDNLATNVNSTAYQKGNSIYNNAKIHENNEVVFNIDLENFFETITERRVYGIFKSIGYAKNVAVDLAKICTTIITEKKYEELAEDVKIHFEDYIQLKEPVLPQGACTSPTLSNLICRKLDIRFSKLANKLGLQYSRYADDITFSGSIDKLPKIKLLQKIINEENFKINNNKVKILKKGDRQMVTGLLVDGKVRIPQKYKKEIFRHLRFCEKFGGFTHFNKINPGKSFRKEWLHGKICFVHSVEPEIAKKMFEKLQQINWEK
ncbi:RNA-directed DNA polymerase [Flavobacterium psychrophilum]|nr:RNA-directed DNA polymerase [Flavobacterium psychrophilum]